jgi:hypothetical protein
VNDDELVGVYEAIMFIADIGGSSPKPVEGQKIALRAVYNAALTRAAEIAREAGVCPDCKIIHSDEEEVIVRIHAAIEAERGQGNGDLI